MKLMFIIKRAYGRERYYPSNTQAVVIVGLTKRICLVGPEINKLRFAGFEIVTTEQSDLPNKESI